MQAQTKPASALRISVLLLLLAVLGLTGCARSYVITLNNGSRITSHGKPKLQGGAYFYKDTEGKPASVPAGRVREIAPASMAAPEGKQFIPSGTK